MTISAALGNFFIYSIFLGFKVWSDVVLKTRWTLNLIYSEMK